MGSTFDNDATVIQQFLDQWSSRDKSFYQKLADYIVEMCKRALSKANIKSTTRGRAKELDSLEAKLYSRDKDREHRYEKFSDIREDIVDLAGVRIAINYPVQKDAVGGIIRNLFDVAETKNIFDSEEKDKKENDDKKAKKGNNKKEKEEHAPDTSQTQWGVYGIFPGYCADHYRVHLKPKDVPEGERWHEEMIEIQVVSTLRDAWATAGHDTIYKNLSIASDRERQLLNGLSMIIYMGECLLNQLHESRQDDEPFETSDQLGVYLHRWMCEMTGRGSEGLGDVSLLWQLLEALGLNGPNTLQNILKMDFSRHESGRYERVAREYMPLKMTTVDYIMDQIVRKSSAQEKIASSLEEAQAEGREDAYYVRVLVDSIVFLSQLSAPFRWVKLMMDTSDKETWRNRAAKMAWLMGDEPRKVIDRHHPLDAENRAVVEYLWSHFATHSKRPVQSVFHLSQLGVVKTRSTDWQLLIAAVKNTQLNPPV